MSGMGRMSSENKLTPGSNLLWEGSRMMLPEHKQRHVEHRQELERRERAELDEQAWGEINLAIADSVQHGLPIRIRMYHAFEEIVITGAVEEVDAYRGRFRVGGQWYAAADIEGVDA